MGQNIIFNAALSVGFSFTLLMIFVPILRLLAIKVGLVDKPNHRKTHRDNIPLIGGISIVVSFLCVGLLTIDYNFMTPLFQKLIVASLIILSVGVIDDKMDIRAIYKLIVQLCCAFYVVDSGIRLTSFYGFFGMYDLPLIAQYIITIILITGIVNANNLMDGIDGLAGGLSILIVSVLACISMYLGEHLYVLICAILFGALAGFLKFNLFDPKKKIFMGDAGSLFLGFILSGISLILLDKANIAVQNENMWILLVIIAIFLIPVVDSIRVYSLRMINGGSPFKADRTHIHHQFLGMNLSPKKVTFIINAIAVSLVFTVGILGEYMTTIALISICLLVLKMVYFILDTHKNLNFWQLKIQEIEKD